jgi:hypothetical protein
MSAAKCRSQAEGRASQMRACPPPNLWKKQRFFTHRIETLNKTGVVIVLSTVVILHIVTMNILYPKIVGKRLRLNPLAVTLSLLFWAWIWGGMGLLLAVPVVGATKIVCDHVDSLRGLGAWLGD